MDQRTREHLGDVGGEDAGVRVGQVVEERPRIVRRVDQIGGARERVECGELVDGLGEQEPAPTVIDRELLDLLQRGGRTQRSLGADRLGQRLVARGPEAESLGELVQPLRRVAATEAAGRVRSAEHGVRAAPVAAGGQARDPPVEHVGPRRFRQLALEQHDPVAGAVVVAECSAPLVGVDRVPRAWRVRQVLPVALRAFDHRVGAAELAQRSAVMGAWLAMQKPRPKGSNSAAVPASSCERLVHHLVVDERRCRVRDGIGADRRPVEVVACPPEQVAAELAVGGGGRGLGPERVECVSHGRRRPPCRRPGASAFRARYSRASVAS